MEPNLSNYPESLFKQPDFEMLFKYFPQESFPTLPPMNNFDQPYYFIGGNNLEKQAFWDGIKDPYNTRLDEQRHDVKYYVNRWKLEGYSENEIGGFNGILVWGPRSKKETQQKVWDMTKEYLNKEKNVASELFAIHWWLKFHVRKKVDPIRVKPFFTKEELKFWKTGPLDPEQKIQLEKKNDQNLLQLIKEYEIELKFTQSRTKAELKSVSERLDIAKKHLSKLKSSIRIESKIRQTFCRLVFEFLVQENVCKSPTGIQMIGAFLIFSSGLSFRKTKGIPNLEFEPDFAKKFSECLKPSKPDG
jgi:hypothetical protein